jgi:hypothetical protein
VLPPQLRDVDRVEEGRKGTISVFARPEPNRLFDDEAAEIAFVSAWIVARIGDGIAPGELIALTRSFAQLDRATAAVKAAGQEWVSLADWPAEDSL